MTRFGCWPTWPRPPSASNALLAHYQPLNSVENGSIIIPLASCELHSVSIFIRYSFLRNPEEKLIASRQADVGFGLRPSLGDENRAGGAQHSIFFEVSWIGPRKGRV